MWFALDVWKWKAVLESGRYTLGFCSFSDCTLYFCSLGNVHSVMFLFSLGRCLNASSFIVYLLFFFCSWWCFKTLDAVPAPATFIVWTERTTTTVQKWLHSACHSHHYIHLFVTFMSFVHHEQYLNIVDNVNVCAAWLQNYSQSNPKHKYIKLQSYTKCTDRGEKY